MTFKLKTVHAWTETVSNGVDVLHVCEASTEKPFASFPKTSAGAIDFMIFMEKAMHGQEKPRVGSDWSTNITEAQTGDYVWLALPCGRVVRSFWMKNARGDGYFIDADPSCTPIAWQPFIKPIHPFELAKQGEAIS